MKMMGLKFLMMFLLISSCGIVDMPLGLDIPINLLAAGLGGDGNPIGNIQCVQKLAPCQAYLNQTPTPPPSCCEPLKEMISNDTKCLCSLIQNQAVLHTFNITKDQAMKIPQSCGANADLSICTSAGTGTSPTSPASTVSNSTTNSPSNSTATAPPPPPPPAAAATATAEKNAANRVSLFGGFAIMSCFLHLIPSLF